MSGEKYFLHLCTIGKGGVTALPADVRRLIYEFTFPRFKARCASCRHVVLVQSFERAYFQVRPYTVRGDEFSCLDCRRDTKTILPNFWRSLRIFPLY